jgi:hypothetical protein
MRNGAQARRETAETAELDEAETLAAMADRVELFQAVV